MPYAVTKAAQWQLVKCMAVNVGPKIRVNTVLPGLLLTEWVCFMLSFLSRTNTDVGCDGRATSTPRNASSRSKMRRC
jgi:NAD(P)-dependent dehydrogenase (short-subunit alcohol dehydrogenase family)